METVEKRVAKALGIDAQEVLKVMNVSVINRVENLQKKINDTILQEVSLLDSFYDAKEIFKLFFDNHVVHQKIFETCLALMTTADNAEELFDLRVNMRGLDRMEEDDVIVRLLVLSDSLEKTIEAFRKTKSMSQEEETAIDVMFKFVTDIETAIKVLKEAKSRFHASRPENLTRVFNRLIPFVHSFDEAKQICQNIPAEIEDGIFSMLFSFAETINELEEMHSSFSFSKINNQKLEEKIKELISKEMEPLTDFDLAFKKAEKILENEHNHHSALIRITTLSHLVPLVVNLEQVKQIGEMASVSSDVWRIVRGQYGLFDKYLLFAADPSDFDDLFSYNLSGNEEVIVREKALLLASLDLDRLDTLFEARKLYSKKDSDVWRFLITDKIIKLISSVEEAEEINQIYFQASYNSDQKEAFYVKWLSLVKTLEQIKSIPRHNVSDKLTLAGISKKEDDLAMEIINSTNDPDVLKKTFKSISDGVPAKAEGIKKWLQITSNQEELYNFLFSNPGSEFASQLLRKLISMETRLSYFSMLAKRRMNQEDRNFLLSAWNNFAHTQVLPQLNTVEQLKEAFYTFPSQGVARNEAISKMHNLMDVKPEMEVE